MLSLEEIKELVRILETSSLNKMELAYEDGKVLLEKGGAPVAVAVPQPMMPAVQPPAAAPAEAPQPGEHSVEITAPIVGTFYSAPDPKAPPFVKVGSAVTPNTVVCVLEAMKLFTEVEAMVEGEITEVLVKDGEFVEFGQPLFKVKKGHVGA